MTSPPWSLVRSNALAAGWQYQRVSFNYVKRCYRGHLALARLLYGLWHHNSVHTQQGASRGSFTAYWTAQYLGHLFIQSSVSTLMCLYVRVLKGGAISSSRLRVNTSYTTNGCDYVFQLGYPGASVKVLHLRSLSCAKRDSTHSSAKTGTIGELYHLLRGLGDHVVAVNDKVDKV